MYFTNRVPSTDVTAVTDAMENMWGNASNTPSSFTLFRPVPATLGVDSGVTDATPDIPPCVPALSGKRRRRWTSAEHTRFLQASH